MPWYPYGMMTISFWWWRLFFPSPMSLWWHFSTLNKIWNGDSQRTPPYIHINSDDHEKSVTINRCCWYEMVMVTIHHYSHYSWRTLNVTTTPILLTMWRLVTVNEQHHIYAPIVTTMCSSPKNWVYNKRDTHLVRTLVRNSFFVWYSGSDSGYGTNFPIYVCVCVENWYFLSNNF